MTDDLSEEEWRKLNLQRFKVGSLLNAVDSVDDLRDHLNDGEGRRPPEFRRDLLRLHALANAVFTDGSRGDVADLFEVGTALEDQVDEMMSSLEKIRETITRLMALRPASLS